MTKTILITGGAGFIGSHFVKLVLAETDWQVVNLDALTYAGNLANLREIENDPRYKFVKGSVTDKKLVGELMQQADFVAHLAAESHVDNSVKNPGIFVETNVLGTQTLLDAAREHGVEKFLQVSTDEVYGSLPLDSGAPFTEESPIQPNSPYSASKAGADLLCRAAHATHGLPIVISRCSNNYGTHQLPEKLIPLTIMRALADEKIPIYGDGKNVRDWIHVTDHCRALLTILQKGQVGEIYNAGGNNEVANLDLVRLLLKILGKPESLIEFVADRPGHDRRYAIDSSKIQKELGWSPKHTNFAIELAQVVEWYSVVDK
jgi:dTDP-glucose 4,6-dehydratase